MLGRPWAAGDLDVGSEGNVARRRGVGVVEVVHQLLDPHCVGRRQHARLREELAHVGVAGGIDVDREGAEAMIGVRGGDGEEGVFGDAGVLVAVGAHTHASFSL